MPTGTRVHDCVESIKRRQNGSATDPVNAFAVCQKSTGQSFQTGKSLDHAEHECHCGGSCQSCRDHADRQYADRFVDMLFEREPTSSEDSVPMCEATHKPGPCAGEKRVTFVNQRNATGGSVGIRALKGQTAAQPHLARQAAETALAHHIKKGGAQPHALHVTNHPTKPGGVHVHLHHKGGEHIATYEPQLVHEGASGGSSGWGGHPIERHGQAMTLHADDGVEIHFDKEPTASTDDVPMCENTHKPGPCKKSGGEAWKKVDQAKSSRDSQLTNAVVKHDTARAVNAAKILGANRALSPTTNRLRQHLASDAARRIVEGRPAAGDFRRSTRGYHEDYVEVFFDREPTSSEDAVPLCEATHKPGPCAGSKRSGGGAKKPASIRRTFGLPTKQPKPGSVADRAISIGVKRPASWYAKQGVKPGEYAKGRKAALEHTPGSKEAKARIAAAKKANAGPKQHKVEWHITHTKKPGSEPAGPGGRYPFRNARVSNAPDEIAPGKRHIRSSVNEGSTRTHQHTNRHFQPAAPPERKPLVPGQRTPEARKPRSKKGATAMPIPKRPTSKLPSGFHAEQFVEVFFDREPTSSEDAVPLCEATHKPGPCKGAKKNSAKVIDKSVTVGIKRPPEWYAKQGVKPGQFAKGRHAALEHTPGSKEANARIAAAKLGNKISSGKKGLLSLPIHSPESHTFRRTERKLTSRHPSRRVEKQNYGKTSFPIPKQSTSKIPPKSQRTHGMVRTNARGQKRIHAETAPTGHVV